MHHYKWTLFRKTYISVVAPVRGRGSLLSQGLCCFSSGFTQAWMMAKFGSFLKPLAGSGAKFQLLRMLMRMAYLVFSFNGDFVLFSLMERCYVKIVSLSLWYCCSSIASGACPVCGSGSCPGFLRLLFSFFLGITLS